MKDIPSFWVDSAARIDVAANKVRRRALVCTWAGLGEGSERRDGGAARRACPCLRPMCRAGFPLPAFLVASTLRVAHKLARRAG